MKIRGKIVDREWWVVLIFATIPVGAAVAMMISAIAQALS